MTDAESTASRGAEAGGRVRVVQPAVGSHEPTPLAVVKLVAEPVLGGDLGASLVVALATIVSIAVVAAGLGLSVLGSRPGAVSVLLAAIAVGVGLMCWLRPPGPQRRGAGALVLAIPSLSVALTAVVVVLSSAPWAIEWFLNGDHPRHAVAVATVWEEGNLSYAVDKYPRGWHAALAAVWSATGAGFDSAPVGRLLVEMAVATLVLSAVLALATAHVGHALAVRVGLSGRVAVAVGLLSGSATLLNPVLANYQALGYENSLLTATVLAVCCREVLVRAGTRVSLVVCSAGLVVIAHSWQPLLPPVAVAAAWCAWLAVSRGGLRERFTTAVCALIALAVGTPGLAAAVVRGTALNPALGAGPDTPVPTTPVPTVFLVLGTVAALVLAVQRRDGALRTVAAVTWIPVVTALALRIALDLPIVEHYYQRKLLWQAAVLAIPWIGVAGALAAGAALERWPGASRVARGVGGAFGGLVVAYSLLMPWGSQLGIWSTVDGRRVLTAVETPSAKDATVVWLQDTVTTDSVTRILLDVLRVPDHKERALQSGLTVGQECALLREADRPAVLSTAPVDAVRQRYACVSGLTVLAVTSSR